jgi:hypothetical protein
VQALTRKILLIILFLSVTLLMSQQGDGSQGAPAWVITRYDSATGFTWYQPPPEYSEYANTFALRVGRKQNGKPWLTLRIAFTYTWDRDIMLIYKFSIRTNKKSYVIRTSFNSINRNLNHLKKTYSEWYDNYVYAELYAIVLDVISAESAVIGFHGINGYAERVIDKGEKEKLQQMLDFYQSLGGDLKFD